MQYSIGEFSKICGLTIDTLRFYEKNELVFSNRDANNRRFYTEQDVIWIEFIIRLKKTGMSIKKMKSYAKLRYEGDSTIPKRLKILFDQLDDLHKSQNEIDDHIKFIEHKIKTYLDIN
ncbi:hypothetical protein FC70_GL001487 [Paucilactobacillus oligofermentans DSM 15707 = LMG 22743]|uniref:HTH merR-type domain-containing protein n=1 Tax=Paucilactobacillus oligofermentans DSM 15707 = LMG 22743 TaxID=1423778 RepID=A0A0R1RC67_9LACO|nr:MerR family transcriptional regulator [Paucilactobacillus oligofermentans]KRL54688.1 hypothetical protein FC70_GL001487 [Paucilactobacillus oligofermentans DSM 15707 = LMG 22743]CUS26401.1 Mercuric resistance operon regulatory protein [Paucilactobacillus oligofermentans DSM 15707 = LMG 22743]